MLEEEKLNEQGAETIKPKNHKKPDITDEDVDESSFLPAYLSANEELNGTELDTDFNTARPNNGGFPVGGGKTDRNGPRESSRSKLGGNYRSAGGVTDRDGLN